MLQRPKREPMPPSPFMDSLVAEIEALKSANASEVKRRIAEIQARVAKARAEMDTDERRYCAHVCHLCGISRSVTWVGTEARRPTCGSCASDRGMTMSLDEYRSMILNRIRAGQDPTTGRLRRYAIGQSALAEARRLFPFHFERGPDASTDKWRRFHWVDQQAIREHAVQAMTPKPSVWTGGPQCERCGSSCTWRSVPPMAPNAPGHTVRYIEHDDQPPILECVCEAGFKNLEVVARKILKFEVRSVRAYSVQQVMRAIGIVWFKDWTPTAKSDPRATSLSPFAYLVHDAANIRARYQELVDGKST